MIPLLIASHLIAGAVTLVAGRRMPQLVVPVAVAPLAVALAVIAARLGEVLDEVTIRDRYRWVDAIGVEWSFRLDGFAALFALLVTGIGVLVLVYAAGYFHGARDVARTVRFAAYFTWFAGAMLGLVTADDVWTLFVFWELTSVLSFLLIGLDDEQSSTRAAAQRALLVTGAGGLVLLGGLVCLVQAAGSARFEVLLAEGVPMTTTAQVGLVLIVIGAFTKSAQVPFHFWLPGAMAAPTPVSAYLHSATMVKAGVILIARFAPVYAELDWWRPTLILVGGLTMLHGGVAALRRDDAKQSLAFGTVSQLGFLVILFGLGEAEVTAAAVAVLTAHAVFKCGLFLTVGAVEHATGSRSLTELSGVARQLPLLAVAAACCTLSMVGVIPLLGFVAKESALDALLAVGGGWASIALALIIVGSVLTCAYSIRLWFGLFGTRRGVAAAHVGHEPGWSLLGPVVFLAAVSLVGGVAAGPVAERLSVAAEALDHGAHVHLALLGRRPPPAADLDRNRRRRGVRRTTDASLAAAARRIPDLRRGRLRPHL